MSGYFSIWETLNEKITPIFKLRKDCGTSRCIFWDQNFISSWSVKTLTQNLATLSILNSIRKYPKICLVMVPIGVQKIETLSSSEKKWQAIENLVHILLEWTLVIAVMI